MLSVDRIRCLKHLFNNDEPRGTLGPRTTSEDDTCGVANLRVGGSSRGAEKPACAFRREL